MASQGVEGFNFQYFQRRLGLEYFNEAQKSMLQTRLDLLQEFLQPQPGLGAFNETAGMPRFSNDRQEREWHNKQHQKRQAAMVKKGAW